MSLTDKNEPEPDEIAADIGFRLVSKLGRVMEKEEIDPDEELELHGTSPLVITFYMALMTLFFPIGGVGLIYNWGNISPLLYGVIWVSPPDKVIFVFIRCIIYPGEMMDAIWKTVPLCTFNFLYIRQIHRFFLDKTSRDIVLFYGILSMIVPSILSIGLWVATSLPYIVTPLPFQFIAGVLLLYKFRHPEVLSPWDGYSLDLSWWTRQHHSINDPEWKAINLTRMLNDHDADWLEGWSDEG